MTHENALQGIFQLASALSFEALRQQGWDVADLLLLQDSLDGVSVEEAPDGPALNIRLASSDDEEEAARLETLADRMRDATEAGDDDVSLFLWALRAGATELPEG